MADLLNTISVVLFIAAGIFAILAVALWFILKIPIVMGDLSGRTAKKSIEQMRKNNEFTGNKSFEPSKRNLERGKLTGTIEVKEQSVDEGGGTVLLKENMVKNFESQNTTLLDDEETSPLEESDGKSKRNPSRVEIKLVDRVIIVHTEEVIE